MKPRHHTGTTIDCVWHAPEHRSACGFTAPLGRKTAPRLFQEFLAIAMQQFVMPTEIYRGSGHSKGMPPQPLSKPFNKKPKKQPTMKTNPKMKTQQTKTQILSGLWLGLFALLQACCAARAQTLSCGDVVQGTINTIGQSNSYTFTANAGEVVRLTPAPSCNCNFNVLAELFGPSNTNLGYFGFAAGAASTITLPASGTYTVWVHDDDNFQIGSYSLSLAFATPKCGTPLVCGQTVSNAFTKTAQIGRASCRER